MSKGKQEVSLLSSKLFLMSACTKWDQIKNESKPTRTYERCLSVRLLEFVVRLYLVVDPSVLPGLVWTPDNDRGVWQELEKNLSARSPRLL